MLLTTLHEDINEISLKPYVELKDSDGRPDDIVATEFWDNFKAREKSKIIDLFYGQLKSHLECTICNNSSVTFDPYSMLSIPVPIKSKPTTQSISIIFYPENIK
jgi:ubiquitin C-terminal hydrolase